MPFYLPGSNDQVNATIVSKWLLEKIDNHASSQIIAFLDINRRNKYVASDEDLQDIADALMRTHQEFVVKGINLRTLQLNLLQIAALKANHLTFEAVLGLYQHYARLEKNEYLCRGERTCGYNVLHLAVLNRNNPNNALWLIKNGPPEAANTVSFFKELPVELAYETHNTELLKPLLEKTTVVFDENHSKFMDRLDPELKGIVLGMNQAREEKIKTNQRIIYLITDLRTVINISTIAVLKKDENGRLCFTQQSESSVCQDSIEKLHNYLAKPILTAEEKLNLEQEILQYTAIVNSFKEKYASKQKISGYQQLIKEVLVELAEIMGIENYTGISSIKDAFIKYRKEGDLSFFEESHYTNKTENETLDYLNRLVIIRNRFYQIANTMQKGDASDKELLVSIYNSYRQLVPLFYRYTRSLLDEPSYIKQSIGTFASLKEMDKEYGAWSALYLEIDAIQAGYTKLGISDATSKISLGFDAQVLDSKVRAQFEEKCRAEKEKLKKLQEIEGRNKAVWYELIKFRKMCRNFDGTSPRDMTLEDLALQIVNQVSTVDDAVFFINEVKSIYFATTVLAKDRERFEALFETLKITHQLRTLLKPAQLPIDKQSGKRLMSFNGLDFVVDEHEGVVSVKMDSKTFFDLDAKDLGKLTDKLKTLVKEQKAKEDKYLQLLDKEIAKLKALVEKYKQLAGSDPLYVERANQLLQVKGQSLTDFYASAKTDPASAIKRLQVNISDAEDAVGIVERQIKDDITYIIMKLDTEINLVKKLRHLSELKTTHICEDEAINTIENKIKLLRKDLKSPLTLTELEGISASCSESYKSTYDLLLKVHYSFDYQKDEVNRLADHITSLLSPYVNDLGRLRSDVKVLKELIANFTSLSVQSDDYQNSTEDLDEMIRQKVTKLIKDKAAYTQLIVQISTSYKAIRAGVSALNQKLSEIKALEKNLQFPDASKHLFDEINRVVDNWSGKGKFRYTLIDKPSKESKNESQEKSIDESQEKPTHEVKPLFFVETMDEFSEVPSMYSRLANELKELNDKITKIEKKVQDAEDAAKKQANKLEGWSVKKAKEVLKPTIDKLAILQQKIAIVDPTSEIVLNAESDPLKNLDNMSQIEKFRTQLEIDFNAAEFELQRLVTKKLWDKVDTFNTKLAELKTTLREPAPTISSSCQKTVKKFTALMGQPEFSKDPLIPSIDKMTRDFYEQSIKSFSTSWTSLEQMHDEAIKALEKEMRDIKAKYDAEMRAKEQEYSDVKAIINPLKDSLNKLLLDSEHSVAQKRDTIMSLLKDIYSALDKRHDGESDYFTFLNQEIANLKTLETKSKELLEDVKNIKTHHQQRTAKINQIIFSLKPAVAEYKANKPYTTIKEAKATQEISVLLNEVDNHFGPELNAIPEKHSIKLDEIEPKVLRLKDLLMKINPVLSKYRDQMELTDKQQIEAARVKLTATLDRLNHMIQNFHYVNTTDVQVAVLLKNLPMDLGTLRTLTERSTSLKELEKANEEVSIFIETHFKPAVVAELNIWLEKFVSLPYQETCQLYQSIQADEPAKKLVGQCIALDKEFEQAVSKTNLFSNLSSRDAFSTFSPYYFSDNAVEFPRKTFIDALGQLKEQVKKHCAKVNEKIRAYKAEEAQVTDAARINYEAKLKPLEALLNRYLAVQGLMQTPDIDEQERLKKIVQDIQSSDKIKAQQYQDTIVQIANETKNLEIALGESLTTLLDDTLDPYHRVLHSISAKEQSDTQMPQSVKDLFTLLLLKAPNKLAKIVPDIHLIATAKEQSFITFIENIQAYATQATTELTNLKDQLDQKAIAALEQEEEDKQKKLLAQTQKETEKAQLNYEFALSKLKALQSRYLDIQGLLATADDEAQRQWKNAIEEIEQSAKETCEQYQDAQNLIITVTGNLDAELRESLKILLAEALVLYHDAVKNLTEEEQAASQVPPAVKDLYQLLMLKAPSHLTDIHPNAVLVATAKDEQFKQFVNHLQDCVKNAATAVNDEKARLVKKAADALQHAENERETAKRKKEEEETRKREAEETKRKKEEEETRKREAEETKRKKDEETAKRKKEEEETRKREAEETKRKKEEAAKRKKEEEETRKREAEEAKRKKEEAAKQKKEEEEARKREAEEAKRIKAEEAKRKKEEDQAAEAQRKQAEEEQTHPEQKHVAITDDSVIGKITVEPTSVVDDIYEAQITPSPKIATQYKTKKKQAIESSQNESAPLIKKKQKEENKREEEEEENNQFSVIEVIEPTVAQLSRNLEFKDLIYSQRETIRFISKLLYQIKAQESFNPDAQFFELKKAIFNASETIRNKACDDSAIEYQLDIISKRCNQAIEYCKTAAKYESFSLPRFLKVLFGLGTKMTVSTEQIEIRHSNTIKFLQELDQECKEKCASLKKRRVGTSQLIMTDTLTKAQGEVRARKPHQSVIGATPKAIHAPQKKQTVAAPKLSGSLTEYQRNELALRAKGIQPTLHQPASPIPALNITQLNQTQATRAPRKKMS